MKSLDTISNKLKKRLTTILTYDKATHFIIGLCAGVAGIDSDLFIGLITAKEVADCYKPKPTGFGLEDWLAGYGGYCLGSWLSTTYNL